VMIALERTCRHVVTIPELIIYTPVAFSSSQQPP